MQNIGDTCVAHNGIYMHFPPDVMYTVCVSLDAAEMTRLIKRTPLNRFRHRRKCTKLLSPHNPSIRVFGNATNHGEI